MIIIKLQGGLGNQLFQYAAANALAKKKLATLKLDISDFNTNDLRNFELGSLKLHLELAGEKESSLLKATNSSQRIFQRLLPYSVKKFYKQPYFHFDKNFFKLSGNVYLQGYFQSEKYFSAIKSQLLSEFDFSHLVSEKVKHVATSLCQLNSVAIHLRRGDYQNVETNKVHGILPLTYYHSAIHHIKTKINVPVFYIFSDAPEKATELGLEDAILVSGVTSDNHFEDLYLMSHCKHNIIANSSFSWWSAWLNQNPDKIVIAPNAWFQEGPEDTYDLIPDNRIRL